MAQGDENVLLIILTKKIFEWKGEEKKPKGKLLDLLTSKTFSKNKDEDN